MFLKGGFPVNHFFKMGGYINIKKSLPEDETTEDNPFISVLSSVKFPNVAVALRFIVPNVCPKSEDIAPVETCLLVL